MSRPSRRTLAVWIALLAILPAVFALAEAPDRWTVDDLVTAERAGDWALAPDGSFAVWVKSTVEKVDGEERSVDRLWWTPLGAEAGDSRQLTWDAASVGSPRISPNGKKVAFLTDRDPPKGTKTGDDRSKRQIWVLPLDGGEAFPVTSLDRGVRGFDWTGPEGLVLAAPESLSAEELRRKEEKDTSVVVEDPETPPVRLFTVKVSGGSGKVNRLTENDDWIEGLIVSPDGRHAVVSAQQSLSYEFDSQVPPRYFLVDLDSGERTALELTETLADGTERALLPRSAAWTPDGSGFYLADGFTRHPVYRNAMVTRVHYHDLESGNTTRVDLDWDRGVGRGLEATEDGFLTLLADGVRFRPARYVKEGESWTKHEMTGLHATRLDDLDLSRDGKTLVYEHSTATKPSQWYAATLDGAEITAERQLTKLNPSFEKKPTGRVEVVRFEGAEGDEVEGLLHYPLDWQEGAQPRPLVLDIHGGPTGTDRDSWDQRWAGPNILWRQKGAFVLQVNYHGSAGYGLDWAESIEQRYYELEIPDIEAGVDHVIGKGLADPERLATTGWSNGGILSAELITRTDRYKAAIIGAADVEWISDWANVDFGASFDNYYFGGPPWEIPDVYIEKSPFFRLTEVETPVLIHTGTEDRNVPPHQSWSLFRALQQIDQVPVQLVLYPGEPHGLRKVAHQRRKVKEDVAWLEELLFGEEDADNPAVQDGSPLSHLLQRAKASTVNGAYGVDRDGVLVPETVSFRDHQVGRFEVTRAQWKAFRDEYEIEPGTENLPVTGISFEDARAYVAWLSETTGESYRLPTVDEAEGWAKAAGGGGVTLERWAGYSPNPEDRERLLEAAAEIGPTALLEPVGSVSGAGEPAVFDLNGNAAEWAVTDDGSGKPVGRSADRVSESKSTVEPGDSYVGLRVVQRAAWEQAVEISTVDEVDKVEAALAREIELPAPEFISPPNGSFRARVPAKLDDSTDPARAGEAAAYLRLDMGTSMPVECWIHEEELDLATVLVSESDRFFQQIEEELPGEITGRRFTDLHAGSWGPHAFLGIDWIYQSEGEDSGLRIGQVKHRIVERGPVTIHCLHNQPGFAGSFNVVVRSLAESMDHRLRNPEKPFYAEVHRIVVDDQPIGFTRTRFFANEAGEVRSSTHLATLSAITFGVVIAGDVRITEWSSPEGELLHARALERSNGRTSADLRLDPMEGGGWHVRGIAREDMDAKIEPVDFSSSLGAFLTRRRLLQSGEETATILRWHGLREPTLADVVQYSVVERTALHDPATGVRVDIASDLTPWTAQIDVDGSIQAKYKTPDFGPPELHERTYKSGRFSDAIRSMDQAHKTSSAAEP